jgi:flagellar hook protein FlgE
MVSVKNSKASSDLTAAQTAYDKAVAALKSAQLAYTDANGAYLKADTDYNTAATTAGAKVLPAANASQGIEHYEEELSKAKTKADDALRAWNLNTDGSQDITLKNAYHDARLELEQAKFDLAVAKADLQAPTELGKYSASNLKDTIDTYKTQYDLYYKNGTGGSESALKAAKEKLDEVTTALNKTETDSLQGKLAAAELAADKASGAVTSAEKVVISKKNALDGATKTASTTATGNTTADETLEQMSNYKILKDGTVTGVASDGSTIILGKIAIAGVQNTSGLVKDTGYYYTIGANAGNVSAYEAGGTEGKILGNYLEMAKVDLSTEMTDMITTQRGFQANSKIITVTDTMLEELVNMKR